jgi:amino acid adenylation domain-containing protein
MDALLPQLSATLPVAEIAARSSGVHQMIAAVAEISPDAIALRQDERSATYGTLDREARSLAWALLARDVAPGSVIAICLPRSIEQVVAMLAVLDAGCGFLVLDPADPVARRRALITDCAASLVISNAALAGDFDGHPTLAIDVDQATEPLADASLPPVVRDDLAYVVYTSGSTGTPNGVEISHGNLINFITWTNQAFRVTRDDVASHVIGLTFDVAMSEIWPYLAAGAAITIVDETIRPSPDLMQQWLVEQGVTIATIPMTMAEIMLKMAWPAQSRVRLMLTGGDVLRAFPPDDTPFALVNNYGPSECTIIATYGVVPTQSARGDLTLPTIGRPISGVAVYLLDAAQHPVAPGEEGEIWIGGAGVGRGYRGRPALTAERYHPDPFVDQAGARMYRTGDRARLSGDGDLIFCGRIDRQTKIRGVRIELDEIAIALQRHPGIGSAVVIAREEPGHDRTLAAYYVASPGTTVPPGAAELRAFLEQSLPVAYLPATFTRLDAMPLTRNAKVDYDALPPPDRQVEPSADRRRPSSDTERALAAIVESVLSTSDIAADDDFFLLGGHSILATQVVIRARALFDVPLTLRDLFRTPTIAGIAATIDTRRMATAGAP